MQTVAFPLNGNALMTIFTQGRLDALEWLMALAAIVSHLGMGHDIGNGLAAVIEGRQIARTKGAATGEEDANCQSHT